jgi:hypothetical protein
MAFLIFVAIVWNVLLLAAVIGLNVRLTVLKGELASLMGVPARQQAPSQLPRSSVVLIVSETCGGCMEAIEALHQAAISSSLLSGIFNSFVVLTPDPDDARVKSPLVRLTDEAAYRSVYPGATPALAITDPDGNVISLQVLERPSNLLRELQLLIPSEEVTSDTAR